MTGFWLIGILAALGKPLALREEASDAPSPVWLEISERTTCEAMQDDYCLGRYGFMIKHDGRFLAGPSPQGSRVEGRVKSSELKRLGALVVQISASATNEERLCDPGGVPGIKDQVDVTLTAGQVVRAYDLGGSVGNLCYVGSWDNARRLHQYLRKLMTQYYPIPFPNDRGKPGRASGRSIKPTS
jgi:hypothetical protein